jgi:hypothetical protein
VPNGKRVGLITTYTLYVNFCFAKLLSELKFFFCGISFLKKKLEGQQEKELGRVFAD